jgi:hypothetical protein
VSRLHKRALWFYTNLPRLSFAHHVPVITAAACLVDCGKMIQIQAHKGVSIWNHTYCKKFCLPSIALTRVCVSLRHSWQVQVGWQRHDISAGSLEQGEDDTSCGGHTLACGTAASVSKYRLLRLYTLSAHQLGNGRMQHAECLRAAPDLCSLPVCASAVLHVVPPQYSRVSNTVLNISFETKP